MAPRSTSTVRLRRLGAELHRLREATGLTLEDAGARLERSVSSLSKIENGRVAIPARDLRVILDVYEVTDPQRRESLFALARDGRKKGWWQSYADVLSSSYSDWISLEEEAASIRTLETLLVPGLLQTEDYARAVLAAGQMTAKTDKLDSYLAVRMGRQAVLTRDENPLVLWVILSEAVLRQQIGGPEVMRAQLRYLAEAAEMPNVDIQVLPFSAGAHTGLEGSFAILEFPEPAALDVVLLENLTSSLYIEDEEDVARYDRAYDYLRASALPLADSLTLLNTLAEEL